MRRESLLGRANRESWEEALGQTPGGGQGAGSGAGAQPGEAQWFIGGDRRRAGVGAEEGGGGRSEVESLSMRKRRSACPRLRRCR